MQPDSSQKPSPPSNEDDFWTYLRREVLAILWIAGGLTTTLWVRHMVERMLGMNMIDQTVWRHGLGGPPPPANGTASTQQTIFGGFSGYTQPHTQQGSRMYTGSASTGYSQEFHTGPGQVEIPSMPGHVMSYTSKLQTVDGHQLFEHTTVLNQNHIRPCPLLFADRSCDTCEWGFLTGRHRWTPKCAAWEKLHTYRGNGMPLSDIRRKLEADR